MRIIALLFTFLFLVFLFPFVSSKPKGWWVNVKIRKKPNSSSNNGLNQFKNSQENAFLRNFNNYSRTLPPQMMTNPKSYSNQGRTKSCHNYNSCRLHPSNNSNNSHLDNNNSNSIDNSRPTNNPYQNKHLNNNNINQKTDGNNPNNYNNRYAHFRESYSSVNTNKGMNSPFLNHPRLITHHNFDFNKNNNVLLMWQSNYQPNPSQLRLFKFFYRLISLATNE